MLGNERACGERQGALLQPGCQPRRGERRGEQRTFGRDEWFKIKVRCPTGKRLAAVRQHADELQAFRNNLSVTRFHFMREQEKQRRLGASLSDEAIQCMAVPVSGCPPSLA